MKLSLVLIAALTANAYADEDHSKDEDQAFYTALQKHDAKTLDALVVVPFQLSGVPFKTAACKQQFGGANAVAKDKKALVACLAQLALHDGPYEKWGDDVLSKSECESRAMIGGYDGKIRLVTDHHPFRVARLELSEMEGEVGGVMGGYRPLCVKQRELVQQVQIEREPPPPPPPPPPPAPPRNVPPTMLEQFRAHGSKKIEPNQLAKEDIAKTGKTKIVGSWKLCVDTDGRPSQVVLLKSTGAPVYDAQIKATIEVEWWFKPYQIDGRPAPVCTAETFIYGT